MSEIHNPMPIRRLGKFGLEYLLDGNATETTITTPHNKKFIKVPVDVETILAAWYTWQMLGQPIQTAFSMLNPGQREFLLTGITDDEWKELFKDDEDDEEQS